MTLKEWKDEKGKSGSEIAAALGVHQSTVHKYLHQKRIPEPYMIYNIQRLTGNRVMLEDWII